MPQYKIYGWIASLFFLSPYSWSSTFLELKKISEHSLQSNIATFSHGSYLQAGSRQFRSLWTRDFAIASRGLYAINRPDVVRDHIDLIFSAQKEDGSLPRLFDNETSLSRYFYLVWNKALPLRDPLKPNFLGGSGFGEASMDTNVLTLLTLVEYLEFQKDEKLYDTYRSKIESTLRYYDSHLDQTGLIFQSSYSDWQDSVWREGYGFWVNMLYAYLKEKLNIRSEKNSLSLGQIEKKFFDPSSGLFFSLLDQPYLSLEGILYFLDLQHRPEVYKKLIESDFFKRNQFPGFATTPNYPDSWLTLMPRMAGLNRYHDSIYWSWLTGFFAKISYRYLDCKNGDLILSQMEKIAIRDQMISEIYKPFPPFRRWVSFTYRSEGPFSMGAGMILDALSEREKSCN